MFGMIIEMGMAFPLVVRLYTWLLGYDWPGIKNE